MRRTVAISVLAIAFALSGCGSDDGDGTGGGEPRSDADASADGTAPARPKRDAQIGLNELSACLERASVPIAATGRLGGPGIPGGEVPTLTIGTGDPGTGLLVFDSVGAAERLMKDPPRTSELFNPVDRTGNVVTSRPSQPSGGASPEQAAEDAAIDRCVARG